MNTIANRCLILMDKAAWPTWPLKLLMVLFGSLLIAIASKIMVPLPLVPFSMQTFAVIFIGILFGYPLGMVTVGVYLLEAALGFPVLAGPMSGMPVLLGPTGGYLLGFVVAAGFAGYMTEKGFCQHWLQAFIVTLGSSLLILTAGVIYLSLLVGTKIAFTSGFISFIAGDVVKSVILAGIAFLLYGRERSH